VVSAITVGNGSEGMSSERFLVTGALGCIGSWVVKRLVDEGVPVTTYDLPGDPYRMRIIMDDDAIARVKFVEGDITDEARFEAVVRDEGITQIIHLAALQVPFVRANPLLGARVNVVGTAIVFETARKLAEQVRGLTYASSIAVYGPANRYPPGPLADNAPLSPPRSPSTASRRKPMRAGAPSTGRTTASPASVCGPSSSTAPDAIKE
jgi:UDP-glucuronate 4-epimerase